MGPWLNGDTDSVVIVTEVLQGDTLAPNIVAQSTGAVEYADGTSAEG